MNYQYLGKLFLLVGLVFLVASCQREDMIDTETEIIINPPGDLVDGRISGQIIGVDGLPISNAEINFRSESTNSDAEGMFHIDPDGVFELSSTVSASKANFFDNYKTFNALIGETTYTQITLIEKKLGQKFDPFQGQRYIIEEAYIDLPNGVYLDSNENELSSDAIMQGYWISPEVENVAKLPGDMNGLNESKDLVKIANYGVLLMELNDGLGNTYSLPEGERATLSFPVNSDLEATAPQIISMWYFDAENAIWIEEGSATLENGSYVGEISHLDYWTVGVGHNNILLEGHIETDLDISNITAVLKMEEIEYSTSINFSENGNFSILIPSGQPIVIEVTSSICDQTINTYNDGPFNNDSSISFNTEQALGNKVIIGTVRDCNGQLVQNGFVVYAHHNQNEIIALENGSFSMTEQSCDDFPIKILAVNSTTGEISKQLEMNLSQLNNEEFTTCDNFNVKARIAYDDFSLENVQMTVSHNWQLSRVVGEVNRFIVSPTIVDVNTGEIVMNGNYVFNEGDVTAKYELFFPGHGFSVTGTCELAALDHEGVFYSYTFSDMTTNVEILDANVFPMDGVGEIDFELTYFD